ncbi:MAG: CBS domain-containing protein [Pirellulaceae bacterium]
MLPADLGTVVTYNPLSLSADTALVDVLKQWNTIDYHPWPIIESDRALVGIVSLGDIVRTVQSLALACHVTGHAVDRRLSEPKARDIMSTRLVTLSPGNLPEQALRLLLQHKFQSLPVVDAERLVGMVTTTDFLRELSFGSSSLCRSAVTQWLDRSPESVDCDASLDDAAFLLMQTGAACLAVLRGDLPLGVVTRRDIQLAKCRAELSPWLGEEFQLPGPVTLYQLAIEAPVLRPGDRLSQAAEAMVNHARGSVAVVNQAGRLVGALTETSLLRAMEGNAKWVVGSH